jgi:uncharacterized protein
MIKTAIGAIKAGQASHLRQLLKRGLPVDELDGAGRSLIAIAIIAGQERIAASLLAQGASIKWKSVHQHDLLDLAVLANMAVLMQKLIEHGVSVVYRPSKFNLLDWPSIQPYPRAVDRVRMARRLIKNGAPINGSEGRRQPIFWAIQEGRTDVMEALIQAGADVNTGEYDIAGRTGTFPLTAAAAEGRLRAVKTLISWGAKIDAQSQSGATALHMAILYEHPRVATALLHAGASVKLVDQEWGAAETLLENKC